MKVYDLIHHYDNGESYEDYREYENHYLYSSLELAAAKYDEKVNDSNCEGCWIVVERELDDNLSTGKELLKSDCKPCASVWERNAALEVIPEGYEDVDDYPDDPCDYYEAEEAELREMEDTMEKVADSILKANYTYHPNVDLNKIVKDVLEIGAMCNTFGSMLYDDWRNASLCGNLVNGMGFLDDADVQITYDGLMFRIKSFGDGILMQFYPEKWDGNPNYTDETCGVEYHDYDYNYGLC